MDRPTTPARAPREAKRSVGPSSMERVRIALAERGLVDPTVIEFAESTATAVDAANAIGTSVERIVKSLVFMAGERPVLVLASGPNRVDTAKLAALVGHPITRANADLVRQWTGFAIGGVPPVGHLQPMDAYCDGDLLAYDEVWASAGTPNAVFALTPTDLVRISNAQVADVAQRDSAPRSAAERG